MNMKKIIAGTSAGVLAVSAMATSAFALDLTTAGATVYNATFVTTQQGTVIGGSDIRFDAPKAAEDITIAGYKVELSVVCDKSVVTKTKDKNKDHSSEAITFTTNPNVAFTDFSMVSNAESGAAWQATITIDISSTKKDLLKAADSTDAYVTNYKAGKVTMNADTKDNASVNSSGLTISVSGKNADKTITRQEARALNANGGVLTLTASNWGTASNITVNPLPTIIRMTIKSDIGNKTVELTGVLESGNGKTVTFNIPTGLMVSEGDEVEDFAVLTLSFTPDNGHTDETSWKDGWNFYGYELSINSGAVSAETTTTTVEPETTTTPTAPTTTTTVTEPTTEPTTTTPAPITTTVAPATQPPVTTPAPSGNVGNTGSNNNEDKNQPTGVVLAFVPAVIAAAGVIISKKRK